MAISEDLPSEAAAAARPRSSARPRPGGGRRVRRCGPEADPLDPRGAAFGAWENWENWWENDGIYGRLDNIYNRL